MFDWLLRYVTYWLLGGLILDWDLIVIWTEIGARDDLIVFGFGLNFQILRYFVDSLAADYVTI